MSKPINLVSAARPFHILTKPVGPICNLDCKYCFYLEKEKLYPGESQWRMSDAVLAEYIRQYIHSQPVAEINFAWQGGEPTLLGVDFFRKVITLQQQFANGKIISNAIQTNGTLLDDEWCEFLAQNKFLVGLSIDGPRELHDRYRVDKRQQPTFDKVMHGLELLKKHGVDFNTLTVVNRANAQSPLEVYRFLKSIGSRFLQFIPLVERTAPAEMKTEGYDFAAPPLPGRKTDASPVTPESVGAEQYGNFLCAIFDEWVRHDVGTTFVQLFDTALGNWMGLGSSLCVFAEKCGAALAIEHNGDLYSCDHYVYPRYRLGNVMNHSLGAMVRMPQQIRFGNDKSSTLPKYCRRCEVRFACNGECPKHRFTSTPDGEAGLNYLCPGYKMFFNHIDPHMKTMARLLQAQRAPAEIMGLLAAK
ncbi:MAG: anaerobic sulfatase-maturation protein [Verrucomicrobiae bacterium]|nr:anaerobic sulfatase-maturation protein [Verrucomicrobiae bacterium]